MEVKGEQDGVGGVSQPMQDEHTIVTGRVLNAGSAPLNVFLVGASDAPLPSTGKPVRLRTLFEVM